MNPTPAGAENTATPEVLPLPGLRKAQFAAKESQSANSGSTLER